MLILGPVGEGTRREQCRKWLAFLDAAKLEWWHLAGRRPSLIMARARVEDGAVPPMLLEQMCHEGMRRVARVYPYVLWGPGPWDVAPVRRVVGPWPEKRRLMRALEHRQVGLIGERSGSMEVEEYITAGKSAPRQRYWLVVGERQYRLLGLGGKGMWMMRGRWSHGV